MVYHTLNEAKDYFIPQIKKFFSVTMQWCPWRKGTFENIVGKGENAGNQHSLISKVFYPMKYWSNIFSTI